MNHQPTRPNPNRPFDEVRLRINPSRGTTSNQIQKRAHEEDLVPTPLLSMRLFPERYRYHFVFSSSVNFGHKCNIDDCKVTGSIQDTGSCSELPRSFTRRVPPLSLSHVQTFYKISVSILSLFYVLQ